MRNRKKSSFTATTFRRALHLLARPVKGNRGRGGIIIQPYKGYGSEEKSFLMGRVFKQPGGGAGLRRGTVARDIVDFFRRTLRWGVGHAVLEARFKGAIQRVRADRNGYFKIRMTHKHPANSNRLWHNMDLELLWPDSSGSKAKGAVFVVPRTARFVVISDIDDTVMFTGVANKAMMMWRMLFQTARSRIAFPGVAAFYRALHRGATGEEMNPLLYVSRGPWALYEVLVEFFNIHRIPVGPILFLREWGLTIQQPFPPPSRDHKLELIHGMLDLYSRLPFILIGDSGQLDPEIYARVVREHQGRVLAIYIRNVNRDPNRRKAIETLAREMVKAGSSLVLTADSFAMASHAAEHGFLGVGDLAEILRERAEQEGEATLKPTREIKASTRGENLNAIRRGELEETLLETTAEGTPPNIVIEPKRDRDQ